MNDGGRSGDRWSWRGLRLATALMLLVMGPGGQLASLGKRQNVKLLEETIAV